MLSDQTKHKLAELFKTQTTYRPNEQIVEQLSKRSMLMFVGATCEGKNAVMEALAGLDDRFSIIGRFTSREPRPGDNPALYVYVPNTDEGVAPYIQAIENHQAVQYAVNLYAHLIYGSMPGDYKSDYCMSDVFSSAIDNFRSLGFKQTATVTVVTQPHIWLQRFEQRFPAGHPQRAARRDEAIESFKWSLAQTTPDHYWVENIDGQPALAAQEALQIATGTSKGQLQAKALAAASLDIARSIRA